MTKRVIVTGASSGIGRATALELAKSGHSLVLVARREDLLDSVGWECANLGVKVSTYAADITSVETAAALLLNAYAPDFYPVLVNCAGLGVFGDFAQMDWKDIDAQIAVNFTAPTRLIYALLPWMLENGGGQIINVLSMAAERVLPGAAAYSASKAGLLMMGKVISEEYRRQGIRITSILPGATDTPIWDGTTHLDRNDMIPCEAVAEAIANLVDAPLAYNVDEITIMPPKGVL